MALEKAWRNDDDDDDDNDYCPNFKNLMSALFSSEGIIIIIIIIIIMTINITRNIEIRIWVKW